MTSLKRQLLIGWHSETVHRSESFYAWPSFPRETIALTQWWAYKSLFTELQCYWSIDGFKTRNVSQSLHSTMAPSSWHFIISFLSSLFPWVFSSFQTELFIYLYMLCLAHSFFFLQYFIHLPCHFFSSFSCLTWTTSSRCSTSNKCTLQNNHVCCSAHLVFSTKRKSITRI